MARFSPSKKFNVPLLLYVVTGVQDVLGVEKKTYSESGQLFWGSFATYGGTETTTNGIVTVEDTATIETAYDPAFTASARVALANSPDNLYEVIGEPENIEQRNRYTKMKVKRVKGGA